MALGSNAPGAAKSRTESRSSRRFSSGVSGQRPGLRSFERFNGSRDVGFRVLDPLRLVDDDDVPRPADACGLSGEIGPDGLETRQM